MLKRSRTHHRTEDYEFAFNNENWDDEPAATDDISIKRQRAEHNCDMAGSDQAMVDSDSTIPDNRIIILESKVASLENRLIEAETKFTAIIGLLQQLTAPQAPIATEDEIQPWTSYIN